MAKSLRETLALLQAHQAELQRRGVRHAAVFGSVARGDARPESDTDILIESILRIRWACLPMRASHATLPTWSVPPRMS